MEEEKKEPRRTPIERPNDEEVANFSRRMFNPIDRN